MVKKIPDELKFGILRKEFGIYSSEGITLDNVPEEYLKKYTEAAIERAKKLKDKHKEKYSDEYYLDMAKRLEMRDLVGRLLRIQEIGSSFSEIKDIQWSQYSYEEILQMEDNGINIPEEVLAWAHSQQEEDETNYVILTENVEGEDGSTQEGIGDPTDINELRKRSIKDIAKVEKAEKETEEYVIRYNEKSKAAKQIQEQKEDTYKNDIEEIKRLTDEWKSLNDKQKNGTQLSNDEQKRYEELGKFLNGSDGKFMKEIQADNHELDSFLDSLDVLNNEIEGNKQIAQETIQNAVQLGEAEAKVYIELPVTKSQVTDLSNSNETLNSIPENEISTVALEKGKDFEQYTNNIAQDLNSESNIKLANFATDYSTLATQAENNTKNTMGDDFEKSKNNDEENAQQDKNKIDDMSFTFSNAFKSATITANATADLLHSETQTQTTEEILKKDNQKSLKDIIKLNIESKKSEAQHNTYISEEEAFLAQLDTIQGQKAQVAATQQQIANTSETPKETEQNDDSSKQDIITKIVETNDKDKVLKEGVKKALLKGIVSSAKSEKTSKDLSKNITELKRTNNNAMTISEQTGIIGTGTFAKSYLTAAIGQALIDAGIPLLPNPTTNAQGVGLIYAGDALTVQGGLENLSGAAATTSSAIGMATAMVAGETGADAQNKVKETGVITKANKTLFGETKKTIGNEENITVNNNTNGENNNTNNTDNTIIGKSEGLKQDNKIQTPNVAQNNETNNNTPVSNAGNSEDTTVNNTNNNKNNSTGENSENNNKEQTNAQNQIKDANTTVPMGFSATNATVATAMTLNATMSLNNQQTTVRQTGENIDKETKNITKIIKEAEKQTTQATSKHNNFMSEAENITKQVDSNQETVLSTDNNDEIIAAQHLNESLGSEYKKVQTQDSQVTQDADKIISGGVLQLAKLQKNTNNFGKNIKDFNSDISKQLDITSKTIVVGSGTGLLGASNIAIGSSLVATGTPLLANLATASEGAALIAAGKTLTTLGTMEATTGGMAAATGSAGLIVNAEAKTNSGINLITERFANTEVRNTDNNIKGFVKSLQKLTPENEEPKTDIENKNVKEEEKKEDAKETVNQEKDIEGKAISKKSVKEIDINEIDIKESAIDEVNNTIDATMLAASASSNASIVQRTETDDKTEKRLTRFNEESIIESRKKLKKVLAVSAASKNIR